MKNFFKNISKTNTPLGTFSGRCDVIWDADTPDRMSWQAAGFWLICQGCENRTIGLSRLKLYRAQDAVAYVFRLCKGKKRRMK